MDDELRQLLYHLDAGAENDIRKNLSNLQRTVQSLWTTAREDGGTEPIRVVDDAGNLRFVIAPYSLLEELGIEAYLAALKDDGTTPTFWVDADTGYWVAAEGNLFINELGLGINEGTAGGKPGQYSPHGVTFYDSGGNAVAQLYEYLSGSTGYRTIQLDAQVPDDGTHKGTSELRVLDSSGNALSFIRATGDKTIEMQAYGSGLPAMTIDLMTNTLGAANTWQIAKKTADESRQSDTTLTADSVLAPILTASKTYAIRGRIFFTTPAAADFKYRFVFAGTAMRLKHVNYPCGSTTGTVTIATSSPSDATSLGAGTDGGFIEFDGICVSDGANRPFTFLWAQNTSTASNTTVKAGSYIEYMEIA